MNEKDEIHAACLAAIRLHIREYGHERWKLVQDRYPEVSQRNFWRLVKKVKAGATDTEILAHAVKKAKTAARKMIPAAPSPAIIAAGGGAIEKKLDFMTQLQELLDDAAMIREWSMTPKDSPGGAKIKNPTFFANSIRLRRDILETALRAMQEIWDLRKMQDFYDTIISTVAEADPATAKLIMERLDVLNNERGLTINAKVV